MAPKAKAFNLLNYMPLKLLIIPRSWKEFTYTELHKANMKNKSISNWQNK